MQYCANVPSESVVGQLISAVGIIRACLKDMDVTKIDLKSSQGYAACETFLKAIIVLSNEIGVPRAKRTYRKRFSNNYRSIFFDLLQNYRVDVLEAATQGYSMIWVNGERFDFSPMVLQLGSLLTVAWKNVLKYTLNLSIADARTWSDFKLLLTGLDSYWAMFEESYIFQLIEIEKKARRLIYEAILLEARLGTNENIRTAFFKTVGRLNSAANIRGSVTVTQDVLQVAEKVKNGSCGAKLAQEVIDSFKMLRQCLRDMGKNTEGIDPHLSNNVVLVNRLIYLEEMWEKALRFLVNPLAIESVEAFLNYFRQLEIRVKPDDQQIRFFKFHIGEQDPEALLAMPRLLILQYLENPNQRPLPLHLFLPNIFTLSEVDSIPKELQPLFDSFTKLQNIIEDSTLKISVPLSKILGTSITCDNAQSALEEWGRLVEHWSVAIQRWRPQEWNQFLQILFNCLLDGMF
eukprot:GHVL01035947.1.p1 GENE.GHVL01035947.1~~GHVL01035947.1.p1  ORF type:complete len:461 (+),score=52.13 GHVL01035947.1:89-1471(+)